MFPIVRVPGLLETSFWYLNPGFWLWEIHWNHNQSPGSNVGIQNGQLWHFWASLGKIWFGSENIDLMLVVSVPGIWGLGNQSNTRPWGMGNPMGPFSDTFDLT